jgi:hypothetical protein
MRRNKKRIAAAVAVVAALAAGGAAYTNSIDTSAVTNADVGYGSVTVNGNNTLSAMSYNFSTDGSQVDSVSLTFGTALTGQDVQLSFAAGGARQDCGDLTGTTVTCTLPTPVDTSSITAVNVLVQDA